MTYIIEEIELSQVFKLGKKSSAWLWPYRFGRYTRYHYLPQCYLCEGIYVSCLVTCFRLAGFYWRWMPIAGNTPSGCRFNIPFPQNTSAHDPSENLPAPPGPLQAVFSLPPNAASHPGLIPAIHNNLNGSVRYR